MSHLTEEQMVDGYYGQMSEDMSRHLGECEECRALFEQQQELLDAIRESPLPERGPGYGGEVWTKLLPQLPKPKQPRQRAWWILVPAFAAMLAVAFMAGRWTKEKPTQDMASIPEKAQERVLLLSLSDHLERAQIVLAQVENAGDLSEERDRARELVGANRLLRQTAVRLGDRKDAAVLEDLEHVLLEVANAPDAPTTQDTTRVQERIAQNELLFKVRIASTDARDRGLKL
jgi:hypothetical protein